MDLRMLNVGPEHSDLNLRTLSFEPECAQLRLEGSALDLRTLSVGPECSDLDLRMLSFGPECAQL